MRRSLAWSGAARTRLLAIALVLATAGMAWADRIELPNGVTIDVTATDDGSGRIAAAWVLASGSIDDPADMPGLTSFVDRVWYQPRASAEASERDRIQWQCLRLHELSDLVVTRLRIPAWQKLPMADPLARDHADLREIDDALESVAAANPDAWPPFGPHQPVIDGDIVAHSGVTRDLTLAWAEFDTPRLRTWADAERSRLQAAIPHDIDALRDAFVRDRIDYSPRDPVLEIFDRLDAEFWLGQSYGIPAAGLPLPQAPFSPAAAAARVGQLVDPARLTIVVAGDITLDAVRAALEPTFGALPARDDTHATNAPVDERAGGLEDRWTRPPLVVLRYPTVPWAHEDQAALRVAAQIASERLLADLGDRAPLSSVLAVQVGLGRTGYFEVQVAGADGAVASELLTHAVDVIAMLESTVTDADVTRAADVLGPVDRTTWSLGGRVVASAIESGLGAAAADVTAVSDESVRAAIARYLDPSRRFVAVIDQLVLVESGDPEFAALSLPDQAQVRALLEQMTRAPAEHARSLHQQMIAQLTPDSAPVFRFVVRRLGELLETDD